MIHRRIYVFNFKIQHRLESTTRRSFEPTLVTILKLIQGVATRRFYVHSQNIANYFPIPHAKRRNYAKTSKITDPLPPWSPAPRRITDSQFYRNSSIGRRGGKRVARHARFYRIWKRQETNECESDVACSTVRVGYLDRRVLRKLRDSFDFSFVFFPACYDFEFYRHLFFLVFFVTFNACSFRLVLIGADRYSDESTLLSWIQCPFLKKTEFFANCVEKTDDWR